MMILYKNENKGFTLVELLVVISLVGILAAVTMSIIKPIKQRQRAEDGVKMSNLQKYALGLEAYGNANSSYPTDAGTADQYPDGYNVANSELRNFITGVPDGHPTSTSRYFYYVNSDNFAVTVYKSEDTTTCFKYRSIWGKIKTCPTASCSAEDTDTGCI